MLGVHCAVEVGDPVREKNGGRIGTVHATMSAGDRMIVSVEDQLEIVLLADWEHGCVVETAPLAAIVVDFIEQWRRDRPTPNAGRRNATEDDQIVMGAYEYLTERTGMSEPEIRSVTGSRRRADTEIRVADALVAAVGRPDALYDGTLTVKARAGVRDDCCGGSTTFEPWSLTGA